jgi:hypothetical protein
MLAGSRWPSFALIPAATHVRVMCTWTFSFNFETFYYLETSNNNIQKKGVDTQASLNALVTILC